MKLKICGINDIAIAREAEALGADYLGFIFVPGTPRAVTASQASEIVRALSHCARLVGVFTKSPVEEILDTMKTVGLDVVQLHRRAGAEDVRRLRGAGYEVWTLAGGAPGDGVLFDSSHGDGDRVLRRGDWKTILAGGISIGNLSEAMQSGADILDVSGSLEDAPGVKTLARLRAFFAAFRRLGR
ncbi:MAG: hypothetical protein ACI4QT_10085 [Kiritimatiellia bacterium]